MDQNQAKQTLLKLKREVSERINAIDRDIRHEGMSVDWTEQASERENDEVLEFLGNNSEKKLVMINFALQRIENDCYLQCDRCGEDIPTARLELLPFTSRCVKCTD